MKSSATLATNRTDAIQKRRELIIESAIECFLTKGFHQTSIRDIANLAGISLGNLYNHFDNKDALIAEISVLEAVDLSRFESLLSPEIDPLKTVTKFTNTYLDYVEQRPNVILMIEITAEALRNPQIADGFIENRKVLAKALLRVLASGVALQIFDPKVKQLEVANLIIDLVEGLAVRSVFANTRTSKSSRKSLHYAIQKCLCS